MNILIVTPNPLDTTSYYRAWGVFPYLAKEMGEVNLISDRGRSMSWVDIAQYDLVYLHRPFTLEVLNFTRYCKEMAVPVWVDYDDDLTSIPEWMSFHDLYMTEGTQKIMSTILQLADKVTASTRNLADRLRLHTAGKEVTVIPNAFNDFIQKPEAHYSENKIVMWRGSDTHHVDLMQFSDAIRSCMNRDDWEWMFFGYNPWFIPKTRHIPTMDPVMYFRTIRQINPGVMYVPLVDNVFNRCKSNINWIEGTMAGAVVLIPNFESWEWSSNTDALVYQDSENLTERLSWLMNGESQLLRRRIHQEAVQYIRENLLLSKVNQQRIEIIEQLIFQAL